GRHRLGRRRSRDRRRGPSVHRLPELPPRRHRELPADPVDGIRLRRGWAEYTVAQAVGLTRVPDNVPLEQAAILADAVSTPFGAVVRTGQVGIGESVGVWGVGGVGTHIVQLARLVGAVPVIAIDIKPAVLDRALELGADHALDAGDPGLRDKLEEITGGRMLRCGVRRGRPKVDVRTGAR